MRIAFATARFPIDENHNYGHESRSEEQVKPSATECIAADGPKRSILTAERLSDLFDAPIALEENNGYYYARPGSGEKPF